MAVTALVSHLGFDFVIAFGANSGKWLKVQGYGSCDVYI